MLYGLGFLNNKRIWSLGFRVWGLGFRAVILRVHENGPFRETIWIRLGFLHGVYIV